MTIVNESIGPSNAQYAKGKELVQTFSTTEKLDSLIRLFTLGTPFYRFVNERQQSSIAFYLLFEKADTHFRGWGVEGISCRGLSMTELDLQMHKWARKISDRYSEVQTFSSSTRDEQYARFYA